MYSGRRWPPCSQRLRRVGRDSTPAAAGTHSSTLARHGGPDTGGRPGCKHIRRKHVPGVPEQFLAPTTACLFYSTQGRQHRKYRGGRVGVALTVSMLSIKHVLAHRHESAAKRPGPPAQHHHTRPEARPGPGGGRLSLCTAVSSMLWRRRRGLLLCAAPRWRRASAMRQCHDVIQGICRLRRSGPLPGPSLSVA